MKAKKKISLTNNPEKFIEGAIAKFIKESPANRRKLDGGKYWDKPLVGFASGSDPLFKQYKKIIGKFHHTPLEIFGLTFGQKEKSQNLSVISWVLPASEDIRKSNRKETKYPSRLWAHTRDFGEQFNVKLRDHVVEVLQKEGYQAVAPMNSPYWKRVRSPRVGFASSWSERHAAYVCGLGTFGLSDGFITPKGKAIRVGSVVTNLPLKPSAKKYPHHQANCLYFFNRTCKSCAPRCPAGAITAKGHDKDQCSEYSYNTIGPAKRAEYGVKITGCGLCQTRVPCESEIPKLIQKAYKRIAHDRSHKE
ncbi:MAG: epoxyqueuosine reductase [Deltaproteobacteria bacterium]|nr:epoxyqueuosine reductase [Deltaproteobacteria bacterium]